MAELALAACGAVNPPGGLNTLTPPVGGQSSVAGPALGAPGVSSLIDFSRSWRLAMPLPDVIAWLQAHQPGGLPQDGSSSAGGPVGTSSAGYSYAGPASQAWQSAELEVEVTASGPGASVLRADAVVVWLDPVPLPDNSATGQRVHVSVARGCPGTDQSRVGVTNRGADLRRRLLPAALPTAGLECRYDGLNGDPWRLRGHRLLNAAAARRVARSIARLPLSHTLGGVVNCPMDDGSAEIIALSYPGRPDVGLWVTLNGCRSVANGFITAGLP
jgi:hypothetical protein